MEGGGKDEEGKVEGLEREGGGEGAWEVRAGDGCGTGAGMKGDGEAAMVEER